MRTEDIRNLFQQFEQAVTEFEGVECWSARELQKLLGYSQWRNFENVLHKAKIACDNVGEKIEYHFADISKLIEKGKGAKKEIHDLMLTRYACYLIAQNGDSSKEQIAFAQNYFALQTRRAELIEQRILDYERLKAREKLSQTEKQLSGILYERGIDSKGFAIIRSKGDKALFNLSTEDLKKKMNVPKGRPVADFLPTISIKAKDLATEMTNLNVQTKDLNGQLPIEKEHIDNNYAVRQTLKTRGIIPENLPPAEDVKKIERKLSRQTKQLLSEDKTNKNTKG